jgi:dihydrofolate synthase/folylpolyglutamate synthase
VIGEYLPETRPLFEAKARQCNAPVYFASDAYEVSRLQLLPEALHCTISSDQQRISENYTLDLAGAYQARNLCTVLCAADILINQGFKISTQAEKSALSQVKKHTGLHGRWEMIARNPLVVLDVGHNPDGIRQLLNHLALIRHQYRQLHFVTGMVKDKDAGAVLQLLPKDATYYFTQAQIPRALPAGELQQLAEQYGLAGSRYPDVNSALQAAKQEASPEDLILVSGSVFLVGEVQR